MGKAKSVIIPKSEIMLKDDEILMASVLDEDFNESVAKLNPSKTKPSFYEGVFPEGAFNKKRIAIEIAGGYLAYMRDRRFSQSGFHIFEPLYCENGRMVIGVPLKTSISEIVETLIVSGDTHSSISYNALSIGNILYLRGLIDDASGIRETMHLIGYNKDLEDGIYNIIRKLYGRVNNAVITDLEQVADFWKVSEFAGLYSKSKR